MPSYICHHQGYFFMWSEVVDAPTTHAMTREEFEDYYRAEHGMRGMDGLDARIGRALEYGTSAMEPMSLDECLAVNRAGPRGTKASFDEIIAQVMAERPLAGPAR